jgi:microcystin-dependent protein
MSYNIKHYNTSLPQVVVEDQGLNVETSLQFPGRNTTFYASAIGENFLHLLENFARNTSPSNPTVGQLWYDTGTTVSPPRPQLKVWDGTKWTEAGNIKKGTSKPLSANSIIGDLWVDISSQQLYLFTGASWILVGPQFSGSSASGLKIEEIVDKDTDLSKFVLGFYVDNNLIATISKDDFTPKATLDGFTRIKQGITLSTKDFNSNGVNNNKFWGTSEKADALIVGNSTVAASNFLRGDVVSTTNYRLNVRNTGGIAIGDSLETNLITDSSGTVLSNTIAGNAISLRTRYNTEAGVVTNNVLVATANKVGINKTPTEALDVNGNVVIDFSRDTSNTIVPNTGRLIVNGNTASTSTTTGALTVVGGSGIGGNLNVGGNTSVGGTLTLNNSVLLATNELYDIGTDHTLGGKRLNRVYANEFYGSTFYGTVNGDVNGNVNGTATSLLTNVTFTVTGDVQTIGDVQFNGTSDVTLNVLVNDSFITNKNPIETTNLFDTDTFLVYRASASPSLRKVTKTQMFSGISTVPIGSIFPFAGDVPPVGYLFCDGSEQKQSVYRALYNIIGYKYKAQGLLLGYETFALPDFRGRFALGRDNMDNGNTVSKKIQANGTFIKPIDSQSTTTAIIRIRDGAPTVPGAAGTINGPFQPGIILEGTPFTGTVTIDAVSAAVSGFVELTVKFSAQAVSYPVGFNIVNPIIAYGVLDDVATGGGTANRVLAANTVGYSSGSNQKTLTKEQMPAHGHLFDDIRWSEVSGTSTYNDPQLGIINVGPGAGSNKGTDYDNGAHFIQHGTYNTGSGQAIDIMNPYQTINYIIYAGGAA